MPTSEYGLLTMISREMYDDLGRDACESFVTDSITLRARADGYTMPEAPTHEWVDLEAPENHLVARMMSHEDEETGEWIMPTGYAVRTLGWVAK